MPHPFYSWTFLHGIYIFNILKPVTTNQLWDFYFVLPTDMMTIMQDRLISYNSIAETLCALSDHLNSIAIHRSFHIPLYIHLRDLCQTNTHDLRDLYRGLSFILYSM